MGFGEEVAIGIVSALLGGYFLASFLVIGWGITKYVELRDQIQDMEQKLEESATLAAFLKSQGDSLLSVERNLDEYTGGEIRDTDKK